MALHRRFLIVLWTLTLGVTPALSAAADAAPAAREVWTGAYRCGPMGESPGYSSSITMRVENGAASIHKESAQIRETLSGQIAPDGTLTLQGAGSRKSGGPVWRYRYNGRFDGARFQAQGEMLSSGANHLRDCSMTLTRSSAAADKMARAEAPKAAEITQKPPPAPPEKAELAPAKPVAKVPDAPPAPPPAPPADKPKAAESVPPKVADVLIPVQTDAKPLLPRAPGTADPLEKEIDLNERNDAAVIEGTVERAVPHRYLLDARKGQVLAALLKADGARFDLYEPGSTLTMLSGGFVVQGSRLGATEDGKQLRAELPQDGKYLLVVRALKEKSFYTLDVTVDAGPGSLAERWRRHRWVWIALLLGAAALALGFLIRRKRDRWLFRSS